MDFLKVAVVLMTLVGAGTEAPGGGAGGEAGGARPGWRVHGAGWAEVALPEGWELVFRCGPEVAGMPTCGRELAAVEFEHVSGAFFAVTLDGDLLPGRSGAWVVAPDAAGARLRVVEAPEPGCFAAETGAFDCREPLVLVTADVEVAPGHVVTFLFGADGTTEAAFDGRRFVEILEAVRLDPARIRALAEEGGGAAGTPAVSSTAAAFPG